MSPNWTSERNVMTIQISPEHPLFNFERLDILCPRIGHPSEMWWPFKFLESLPCLITSVYMTYVPQSDIRVKSYDHSNFSRAAAVQFRASRWVMYPKRTSVWIAMTIRICREFLLFNFERLDILFARIGHSSKMLWPFEFLESFRCSISSVWMSYVLESNIRVNSYDHSNLLRASVVQFRVSRYNISSNRTSVWNLMTIRISRDLTLFNFELLDILFPRIGHPCEFLWPSEFLEILRCSISSFSISYITESDLRLKSYNHSNFSSASVVQYRASRYIMSPNRTSEWNVMTIRIPRELPLFNFERLDIIFPRIGHSCEI